MRISGAQGNARGFEVAYQQHFDKLPGWLSGFGVQANFTFVDSNKTLYNPVYPEYCSSDSTQANLNLAINGCDTDGRTFGNLPLEGLSRQAANLAFMYDKGPCSARLAYSWRSKSLLSPGGTRGGDALDTTPASATFGKQPKLEPARMDGQVWPGRCLPVLQDQPEHDLGLGRHQHDRSHLQADHAAAYRHEGAGLVCFGTALFGQVAD
ncbi:hypothetical protein RCH14_000962 [Massilia sp. MP_M2]|uniref:hypothetical protein n=1 Tax=Massilia sp. MP_M2 TaxID=3071713 RepID=UPI00319E4E0A